MFYHLIAKKNFDIYPRYRRNPRLKGFSNGVVLATRNAWSRVKRLAGKARFFSQSVAPAAQGGRRHRPI